MFKKDSPSSPHENNKPTDNTLIYYKAIASKPLIAISILKKAVFI